MADENGSTEPLRAYKEKTLVIVLPGDLTVFDIGKKERKKMKSLLCYFTFFFYFRMAISMVHRFLCGFWTCADPQKSQYSTQFKNAWS